MAMVVEFPDEILTLRRQPDHPHWGNPLKELVEALVAERPDKNVRAVPSRVGNFLTL